MSQIALSQAERIAALQRFGYGEPEAAFLCLAALHGGYFLRRQYAQFLSRQDGGTVSQLMQKALRNGHVRVSTWRQNTLLYHLCSRPFYEALGQEDNRNRRPRQLPTIKNKIMGFDFVLAHPDYEYLATEQEKLRYFTGVLQLKRSLLPAKHYTSHSQVTDRYFVEKYPLFLAPCARPAAPPVVSFCFVDEGSVGLSGFRSFLDDYSALMTNLREFRVIYVAARAIHFEAAAKAFTRFLIRGTATPSPSPAEPIPARLRKHFELRYLYETQQWNEFDRAKLIHFRNERDEYSGVEIDALYTQWKLKTRAGAPESSAPKSASVAQIHGTFSTDLLEHNYGIFDHVAVL